MATLKDTAARVGATLLTYFGCARDMFVRQPKADSSFLGMTVLLLRANY
jgi:hypothetical protein